MNLMIFRHDKMNSYFQLDKFMRYRQIIIKLMITLNWDVEFII